MSRSFSIELIALAEHDLLIREKLLKEDRLSGYNPEMEAVHRANAARLREIIREIGWPTISKVGQEASDSAWLIVQHAIGEPVFMKECYQQIRNNIADVNPQNQAFLYDRICFFEGKPQKYGTQLDDRGLYPVADKTKVNALRQEVGLPPHSLDIIIEISEVPDGNLHRDERFNLWRKKVGWI